ncbi:MAG TPA: hypothetical protein GXX36_01665 [Clostridiaceae bacterium]|nr:hypothetical protein [Clostridiaceae bacterium]
MNNDLIKEEQNENDTNDTEIKGSEVVYNPEKDFYRGMSGELRFKAEGLFKKAKEKGISIEEVSIDILKENQVDFPWIGVIDLPAYIVEVKGRDIQTGQTVVDCKQIDYYNRYQKYLVEKIQSKKTALLSEQDMFDIGKNLIADKEFGIEKTITGACDRVIRKLMGENDWLYPEEIRLLDEEFDTVQKAIAEERERRRAEFATPYKKATERQINYLKARIKNLGMDPENEKVMKEVLRQAGFGSVDVGELSTSSMSKLIDGINEVIPKVREELSRQEEPDSKNTNTDLN